MTVDVSIPIKSGIGNGGVACVTPHLRRTTKQAIKCTQETISRILKPHTYLKDDVVNYVTSLLRDQFDALVGNVLASHVQNSAKRTDTGTCPGHVQDTSGTCPGQVPSPWCSPEGTGRGQDMSGTREDMHTFW
jgi:hypothetical protein